MQTYCEPPFPRNCTLVTRVVPSAEISWRTWARRSDYLGRGAAYGGCCWQKRYFQAAFHVKSLPTCVQPTTGVAHDQKHRTTRYEAVTHSNPMKFWLLAGRDRMGALPLLSYVGRALVCTDPHLLLGLSASPLRLHLHLQYAPAPTVFSDSHLLLPSSRPTAADDRGIRSSFSHSRRVPGKSRRR